MKTFPVSPQIFAELKEFFSKQEVHRPFRRRRYDPGDELHYDITGIFPPKRGRVSLKIEQFVGGGFAGQVYQVRILDISTPEGSISGLEKGRIYALKILVPVSGFARWFRNTLYLLAFQGSFSPQVNPAAARAGAIWQKLIRRGAKGVFGSEDAVVDILATCVDHDLGSCGEICEWVDGRTWRFEVDDNLDGRRKWKVGRRGDGLGSQEYRAKKSFMAGLVRLMHEMGAWELARQYEWWTGKSQPNVLKRREYDRDPESGHVAVDFRAGLALLPVLPMSPVDVKLILKGIARRSLVQFDRGDLKALSAFMQRHPDLFADMQPALEELTSLERSYRSSLPDVTHHHVKLLGSRKLWASILDSHAETLKLRGLADSATSARLPQRRLFHLILYVLGIIPWLGNFLRRLGAHAFYRRHYLAILSSPRYFRRAFRARMAESLIRWHRSGRTDAGRTQRLSRHGLRFAAHLPLSLLPATLHRFFTDRRYARFALDRIFARPVRLYFRQAEREKWLQDMIAQGKSNGMLTEKESTRITSQIKEPFIQKYLKSLAVHVCTVPVTQIVSVLVAVIYVRLHPEFSWQEASLRAGLILGLFQVTPISPGSLVRGLYVTFLVIRERNFKDYNIAFFLSFFKYIGYLAFPIQMAYRYPDLARFMAGHWATGAVHIVPVFGEQGALLEHAVFDMFYNYPLTIRRRLRERQKQRAGLRPRYRHLLLCAAMACLVLVLIDLAYFKLFGRVPSMRYTWWLALWVPFFSAVAAATWARGAPLSRRILSGAAAGGLTGLLYAPAGTRMRYILIPEGSPVFVLGEWLGRTAVSALWLVFIFTLIGIVGAFVAETRPVRDRHRRPGI